MPIAVEYVRDGQELWIILSGRVGMEDVQDLGRKIVEDPRSDVAGARLVDLREADLDLFLEDLRKVLTSVCGHPDRTVALVARQGAVFGIARQLESLAAGADRPVRAFLELDAALEWMRAPQAGGAEGTPSPV